MKDLYSKLGIGRNATTEEVAAALELRPELKAFATILLDGEKRAVYDRTHAALSAVGILRHHLGLEAGGSEFVKNYPNFAFIRRNQTPAASSLQPGPEPSSGEAKQETREPGGTPAKSSARPAWLLPLLVGLSMAILLVLLFLYF